MWFRDSNGKMRLVLRDNFHTDSEYCDYITDLYFKKKILP